MLADNALTFLLMWEDMLLHVSTSLLRPRQTTRGRQVRACGYIPAFTHAGPATTLAAFLLFAGRRVWVHPPICGRSRHCLTPAFGTRTSAPELSEVFGSKAGIVPLHVWLPRARIRLPPAMFPR